MDSDDANKSIDIDGELVSSPTIEIEGDESAQTPSDHSAASMKNDESAFAVVEIWQVRIIFRWFTRTNKICVVSLYCFHSNK